MMGTNFDPHLKIRNPLDNHITNCTLLRHALGPGLHARIQTQVQQLAQAALHAPPEVALQCVPGHCYNPLSFFLSLFFFPCLLLSQWG